MLYFYLNLFIQLRLFALNTPLSANEIYGVSGADYKCYRQARKAKVAGTYRAVLTSRLQSIDSLVFYKDQDLTIVNSKVGTEASCLNGEGLHCASVQTV